MLVAATLALFGLIGAWIEGVHGWGPYTHAGFGTLYYKRCIEADNGSNAFQSNGANNTTAVNRNLTLEAVFVTANSFPDAFKYERKWMHTLEYAAFQVERAFFWSSHRPDRSNLNNRTGWNKSLDFILTDTIKAFSYGYLLHLLEDYVGHHTGGYLNPKKDHRLEFDVDTFLYWKHKDDAPPWFYRNNGDKGMSIIQSDDQVRQEIADFVFATSQTYYDFWMGNKTGTVNEFRKESKLSEKSERQGLSTKDVKDCIRRFTRITSKVESIAMKANFKTFRAGMIKCDICNAQTFQAANTTLQTAMAWAEESLAKFEEKLFPFYPSSKGNSIDGKVLGACHFVIAWIDQRYKQNGGTICIGTTAR